MAAFCAIYWSNVVMAAEKEVWENFDVNLGKKLFFFSESIISTGVK